MLALIWTYPMLNFILVSYAANSRWVYDLMMLMTQNAHPRLLRQQFNVFVCALLTFCIMMYLFYAISLPIDPNNDDLPQVFYFIAVFEWICAAILLCSIILYVKRIEAFNPVYGRAVTFEAVVLIGANVIAGFFNLWLARGGLDTLMYDRDNDELFIFTIILVPYFAVTEFLPSIVIASTLTKFSKVLTPMANEDARARQQRAVDRVIQGLRQNAPNAPNAQNQQLADE